MLPTPALEPARLAATSQCDPCVCSLTSGCWAVWGGLCPDGCLLCFLFLSLVYGPLTELDHWPTLCSRGAGVMENTSRVPLIVSLSRKFFLGFFFKIKGVACSSTPLTVSYHLQPCSPFPWQWCVSTGPACSGG